MKWIKNFIGRFQGYSGCAKCKDTWNWKKSKDIQYTKNESMFALCEECFNKLDIQEIIYWYEDLLNSHVRSTPIDYTSEKIKRIRQTLKDNIIKEKVELLHD
jgi:NAD-dependent SIR2 family protein deacetylase